MTNAERFRNMTDNELAETLAAMITGYLERIADGLCYKIKDLNKVHQESSKVLLDWLKQEVSDGSPKD